MRPTIITAAIIGALCFVGASLADENDKKTTITVNETILVPGKQLPPGKYVMKLANVTANRHVVQIFNEDQSQLQATILAFPNQRVEREGDTVLTYWETPAGSPPALRAWFWPGDTWGQEFAYPREMAEQISRNNKNANIASYEATGELTAERAGTIEVRDSDKNSVAENRDAKTVTTTDNGNPVVNGAEAAGRAVGAGAGHVVNGAEATGEAVADGAKAVGEGTATAARAVGEGTADAARAVGEGTVAVGKAVGEGAADAGRVAASTAVGAARGARDGFEDVRDADDAKQREEDRQREIRESGEARTNRSDVPTTTTRPTAALAPEPTTAPATNQIAQADRRSFDGQADREDTNAVIAQNTPAPNPVTPGAGAQPNNIAAQSDETSELPQTASPFFTILAAGFVALGGAYTIRRAHA